MRFNVRSCIFPETPLNEGYALRLVKTDELTEEDRKLWWGLQELRKRVRSTSNLRIPESGAVVFAEFEGEAVGCICVKKLSDEVAEHQHAMVLIEHRRKGLFKAMSGEDVRFCADAGFKWLNLSPGSKFTTRFWLTLGAVKGWASTT